MNGIKKAALFLSSLDYSEADQLLCRLDAESAKLVRREIMSLRLHNVTAEEANLLDEEFLYSAGWKPARSEREHQLATPKSPIYTPPKRPAVKYSAESFIPPVRSFSFLQNWSISDIVTAIVDEHPQAIAVVLAHLPQSKMKSVLSALPQNLQQELEHRLDNYDMPADFIVQEIEASLKMRYRNQHRTAKHSVMLKTFDDMEMLSDAALATLFRSVDLTTAMLAMIGADAALITRITKHFTPTEEHEMRHRLKTLGSINTADIEQARQDILEQYNATI